MKFISAGRTHVGQVRSHNEDSLRLARDLALYVVADGVGGGAAGEVASTLAVETLAAFIRASDADAELTWPYRLNRALSLPTNQVLTGIRLANREIYEAAGRDPSLKGMATTVVACLFRERRCVVAHVGDSRIYRLRDGVLEGLTVDHSFANELRAAGDPALEALAKRFSHVIVRAVGSKQEVQATVAELPVVQGDVYLLCTDGLTDMVEDREIASLLKARRHHPEAACAALVDAANAQGGRDNVTAVVIRAAA